jgi:hypothetical protein
MADVHPVCRLAAGMVSEWLGLRPFPLAEWPDCLGPGRGEGWLQFHHESLHYREFCSAGSSSPVRLYAPGDADVCLVEVTNPPSPDLGPLGPPELTFNYPAAARLQHPVPGAGKDLTEAVYGSRGLAALLSSGRVIRLRGFQPVSAAAYRDRFVELPPIRWFPDP